MKPNLAAAITLAAALSCASPGEVAAAESADPPASAQLVVWWNKSFVPPQDEAFKEVVLRFPKSKYAEDSRKRLVSLVNAMAMSELYAANYISRVARMSRP